jgi:hypothetical protein
MALMQIFSVPRPSGSPGEQQTLAALRDWLTQHGIAYRASPFRLYPYSNELTGLWLLLSSVLLTLTILLRWPWPMLVLVGVAMALVILNVVLGWPLVIWPIARTGQNILVNVTAAHPERELVIATHYDSKTELFDHTLMGTLFGRLPLCIGLAVVVLLLGGLDRALFPTGSPWSIAVQIASLALVLPVQYVVGAVGINLLPGRLIAQSSGAVDNGAACAILLALAEQLATSDGGLQHTNLTLAFFGGEEVGMQGSRAYVRSRAWPLPTAVINMELLGQNGPYVFWQSEGNVLTSAPTDRTLSTQVASIVQEQTGQPAQFVGGINSDGYSFIQAGLPTCVFGSYDTIHGGSGLHRPSDHPQRVAVERLPETVAILAAWVQWYDR